MLVVPFLSFHSTVTLNFKVARQGQAFGRSANKKTESYRRMFETVKRFWSQLNPSSVFCSDFEQAAIGAINDSE